MTEKLHVECHAHTCFSGDCRTTLTRLLEACQATGINCIAITDHNTIEGAVEFKKYAPLKVIVGEEIFTRQGEIIGYFLQEVIPAGLTARETVQAIKKQGGLVCVPHPFDRWRGSALKSAALHEILADLDIIEIFNGRNLFSADNEKAWNFAKQHGKLITVGSDSHFFREIGCCRLIMPDFSDSADFKRKLAGATYICESSSKVRWRLGTSLVKMLNLLRG